MNNEQLHTNISTVLVQQFTVHSPVRMELSGCACHARYKVVVLLLTLAANLLTMYLLLQLLHGDVLSTTMDGVLFGAAWTDGCCSANGAGSSLTHACIHYLYVDICKVCVDCMLRLQ